MSNDDTRIEYIGNTPSSDSPKIRLIISSAIINTIFYKILPSSINPFLKIGGGIFGTGDEIMVYSVCYSSGYFIYDLILMFIDKTTRSNSSIIHHILILLSFLCGLFYRICHPCHFYFLAEELSTIPLNLKTIFRNKPLYGSIICVYGFRAAPQFFRMALDQNDLSSFFIGLSQASLCILTRLLNFYWAYLIFQKILNRNKF